MDRGIRQIAELDFLRSKLYKEAFTLGRTDENKAKEYSELVAVFNELWLKILSNIELYENVKFNQQKQYLDINDGEYNVYIRHHSVVE